MKKYSFKNISAIAAILLFATLSASAQQRGRVQVIDGFVRSDSGKALRGVSFFIDLYNTENRMKNDYDNYRNYFRNLSREYNLDLVRIICYSHDYDFTDPMKFEYIVEELVKWCEEDGIYAIINYHTHWHQPMKINFIKDFWDYYAPIYKDHTHVFYELVNEPLPADSENYMETLFYRVRDDAPDTHIICWSASRGNDDELPLSMVQEATDIDYSNASVGFHDYSSYDYERYDEMEHGMEIRAAGYPIICTEFHCGVFGATVIAIDWNEVPRIIGGMEDRGISWCQWLPVAQYQIGQPQILFSNEYWEQIDDYGASRWPKSFPGAASDINVLENPGFENYAESWFEAGYFNILESSDFFSGETSLLVSDRVAAWAGPRQTVTDFFKRNGKGEYILKAMLKSIDESTITQVALEIKYEDGSYDYPMASGSINTGEWTEIVDTVYIDIKSDLKSADFYVATQADTISFLLDDCSLRSMSIVPPDAPQGLTATTVSEKQIDLSWSENSDQIHGYRIERSEDGELFSYINKTLPGETSWSNKLLKDSTTYYYRIKAYNANGNSDYSLTEEATTLEYVNVAEKISSGARQSILGQNYPNPIILETTIPYTLVQAGKVELKILDVTGRYVIQLVNCDQLAGKHKVDWNIKNENYQMSKGLYFYQIRVSTSNEVIIETRPCLVR